MTLFTLQENTDTIAVPVLFLEVFGFMLVSFLIGYLFAFYYQKAKYSKKLEVQAMAQKDKKSTKAQPRNYPAKTLTEKEEQYEDDLAAADFKRRAFAKQVQEKPVHQGGLYLDFERIGYADASAKDNLQKIMGIGPYTEEKLNEIGIYNYSQIAKLNEKDIEVVTELIKFFPDRIRNDRWVSKAKILEKQKKAV